jgi:hypothetical protein
VTENPNTQPDPNAGQPPGGPVGTPSTPSTPPAPSTPTEPAPAAARPAEPARAARAAQPAQAGGSTDAARTESADPAAEPPVTQHPPTGEAAENPWTDPAEQDTEHLEGAEFGEPADPNAPNTGVAATFLPGIDAASVLALVVAALAAGAFLLVNPLVQAHDAARTWSDFKNNVPRTKQDPFGLQRDWVDFQSWAHIILGLVAVLLALLVLAMWTARRNSLRSRSFAQAALVLGLAVVLYGILLKTGAVGSEIPSMKDISTGLSSSSSQ